MKRCTVAILFVLATNSAAFAQFKLVKSFVNTLNMPTESSMTYADWVIYKDEIYFIANSDLSGKSIYKSDGTIEGTTLVIDPMVGAAGPGLLGLVVVDNTLFFCNNNASVGGPLHLYSCDGTPASVKKLGDVEVLDPLSGNTVGFNGNLYFTGGDVAHGFEVWKSNGTEEGTALVKDVLPGSGSSGITQNAFTFAATGNYVYFRAKDDSHGYELWRTDGTEQGTMMVADINSAANANGLPEFGPRGNGMLTASIDNTLYFIANDGTHGYDLWKTDGTSEGTVLVRNEASDIDNLVAWNNKVIYATADQLFATDGTPGTATSISDAGGYVAGGVELDGVLYYLSGSDLWKTDGTPEGTAVTNAETTGTYAALGANSNSIVLISSPDGVQDDPQNTLWTYDGETPALNSISSFNWLPTYSGFVQNLATYHDRFFLAYDDLTRGGEPWITDGTEEGTIELADINKKLKQSFGPGELKAAGSKVFFRNTEETYGGEVWVSDGTDEGTTIVKDLNPGPAGSLYANILTYNDLAIFGAFTPSGINIFRSDGTEEGTFKISDGNTSGYPLAQYGVTMGGNFYYDDAADLWKTDGTAEGTVMVKDIVDYGFYNIGVLNNTYVLFLDGNENLWKSDGTTNGTVVVKNVKAGPDFTFQSVQNMMSAGELTYFIADDGVHGFELWRTDGTTDGTFMVKDVSASDDGFVTMHGVANGIMIFSQDSGTIGTELWRTDGTSDGTFLLHDINKGSGSSYPQTIYNDDNTTIYLFAKGESGRFTMWKTDGSVDGTTMIMSFDDGFDVTWYGQPELFNGRVFMSASTPDTGFEIWKTNFTPNSTRLAGELVPGPVSSEPFTMTKAGDNVFFIAKDESNGISLWTLDPDYVYKQDQEIDFEEIGERKSTDPPFTLTATATSGLAVSFEIVSGPATVSGDEVTITGAGTVVVRATQDGNDLYFAATQDQAFVVDLVLGMEDKLKSITAWPNPATNTIWISPGVHSIELHDTLGRNVLSTGFADTIDVGHLPRGMYLVRLKTYDRTTITKKIILK